jgi:hypothetical protein
MARRAARSAGRVEVGRQVLEARVAGERRDRPTGSETLRDAEGGDARGRAPEALAVFPAAAGEERWSAERRLGAVFVQAASYRPAGLVRARADERLVTLVAVAAAIEPDRAAVQHRLAGAPARRGDHARALEHLGRAIEAGWRDRARLEADPSFATLRREGRHLEALRGLDE